MHYDAHLLSLSAGSDEKSGGGGEDDVVDDARREERKNNRRWPPRAEEEERREGRDTIRISLSLLVDGRQCETCRGERIAYPKDVARGMKLESGAITNAHDVEVDWTTGHWTFKDLGDMASYQ